jgi:hypothetical protein
VNGEGTDGERQANGRFAKGNPGGPGGARKRSFVLREAAENAITPEHVAALMRKALRMGLEGNLTAMRLVLDRSCGRPADVATSAEPLDLALPPMGTAKECSAALEQVASALCEGRVSLDAAHTLVDLIAARIKGIETLEIEQRLLALERSFDAVELDQRRR